MIAGLDFSIDPGRFDSCFEIDRVELGTRVALAIVTIHSHRGPTIVTIPVNRR